MCSKKSSKEAVSLGAYAFEFAITHISKRLNISTKGQWEVTFPLRSRQAFQMDKKYLKTHGKVKIHCKRWWRDFSAASISYFVRYILLFKSNLMHQFQMYGEFYFCFTYFLTESQLIFLPNRSVCFFLKCIFIDILLDASYVWQIKQQ